MPKTRLTNDLRQRTCQRILDAAFREREDRHLRYEHGLALRVFRRELGEDALARLASLPPEWFPRVTSLRIGNEQAAYRHTPGTGSYVGRPQSLNPCLRFAESVAAPAYVAHGAIELHATSLVDYLDFVATENALVEERRLLREQVLGTLGGFYTVEAFAEGWPEGYAHFPHPELAPTTLPAFRVEDLNARLAAVREAA